MRDRPRAGTRREVWLDATPQASPLARTALCGLLEGSALAHRTDDALLALSELVTNAVLHGRAPILLTLALDDESLRVDVHDGSPVSPSFSVLDPTAVTGRGLMLISACAEAWGVEPTALGKSVWFLMHRTPHRVPDDVDVDALLASWGDDLLEDPAQECVRVVLTALDTGLIARSEAHVEAVLRELALVEGTGDAPVAQLTVARRVLSAAAALDPVRSELKRQLSHAVVGGAPTVDVELAITRSDSEAVRDFTLAMDEADVLSRRGGLLMAPAPRELSDARQRYLRRVLAQLSS